MDYLAAAKRGVPHKAPKPVPVPKEIKKYKKKEIDIDEEPIRRVDRKSREHQCRKCNEIILSIDVDKHLLEKHAPAKGFYYVVCPKCMFYLRVSKNISYETALQEHNSEKHFMKRPQDFKDYVKPEKKAIYKFNPETGQTEKVLDAEDVLNETEKDMNLPGEKKSEE